MSPSPQFDADSALTETGASTGSSGSGPGGSWVGRRLGPYKIQKLLGKGGMGSVYLANRDDDNFRKSVAIKVLRFETDDATVLARFRNERQILASLDHPNIAALYDGGSTDEGLPYIIMEHVDGKPLHAYCEAQKLSVNARLRLFRQICDAVQYAHQKLIVHRDLKPGNILVTSEGTPKLLDFGIAKLLIGPELLGEQAVHTQTGAFVMTPDYASPEQIRGQPISTATDIYGLGAVLYELLTGLRPHILERYDPVELQRKICQSDPKPPSALGCPELRGDLDNIVLKALQRDPARRYRSVEQFSEDILRHLENRPVMARPDTMMYRLSRFTARNRWGIAASVAVALSLTAGTAVSLYQASVARQRFQDVRSLAGKFIEMYDDVARLPGSTAVREKLVTSALEYLNNLSRSAGRDPDLLDELGTAYGKVAQAYGAPGQPNLGRTEDALINFRKAIEFENRAAAFKPAYFAKVVDLQTQLAYLAMLSGHVPEARTTLESASSRLDQMRAANPSDAGLLFLGSFVASTRGDLMEYEQKAPDALPFYQQARTLSTEYARLRPDKAALSRLHLVSSMVVTALIENRRYEEALAVLHESAPVIDGLLAVEPNNPGYLRQKMAVTGYEVQIYDGEEGSLGKPAEAVAVGRRYIELAQKLADADQSNFSARLSLAIALYKVSYPLGKTDPTEALAMVQRSISIFDSDLAKRPNDRLLRSRRARALRYLAYALDRNRRPAEAHRAIEEAIRIQEELLAQSPSDGSEKEALQASKKAQAGLSK